MTSKNKQRKPRKERRERLPLPRTSRIVGAALLVVVGLAVAGGLAMMVQGWMEKDHWSELSCDEQWLSLYATMEKSPDWQFEYYEHSCT